MTPGTATVAAAAAAPILRTTATAHADRRSLRPERAEEAEREYTLAEIGQELGITRERVRQIEAQALRKVRAALVVRGFTVAEWREYLHTLDAPPRVQY